MTRQGFGKLLNFIHRKQKLIRYYSPYPKTFFCYPPLNNGTDIRVVKEILGHSIYLLPKYTHILDSYK